MKSETSPSFSHYPAIPPPVSISLTTLPSHPCNYFPDRIAQTRAILARQLPGAFYQRFMDAGFRRSGTMLYQPVCAGCRDCRSIRVPVGTFVPTKSQRRCWRQNQDISVSAAPPVVTEEAYDLYMRYVRRWHGRESDEDSPEAFQRFLYDSPVDSLEFKYRDSAGKLIAVGICDVSSASLSSVYFYFEPAESRRSLGTFGALFELEYARLNHIDYYYLGYWIEGCETMQYKNRFRPCELLGTDGKWVGAS
jgi:arginyl-tRNA--protein-N-Asp/Glu arginylyltransferase